MSESLLQQVLRKHGADNLVKLLGHEGINALKYEWAAWARPEQLAPQGDWLFWLLLAGRGFGKTRSSAEWARGKAKAMPGSHGAIVAPTSADARDVMVKALLECTPASEGLLYEPSKRSLTWANGTSATLYSAEEPDRLRGPQHGWAVCDEVCVWAHAEEVWDMLMMTMRLGPNPQVCVSTTPRPIPLIRRLIKDKGTIITRGSTFDNAKHLSPTFIAMVKDRYEGSRLGRQELHAELLEDVEGALWNHALIDKSRRPIPPRFTRIVVAVDPAGSAKRTADEAGIVVAGLAECGCLGRPDMHGFILEDLTGRYSPRDMGAKAIGAYHKWQASRLVAEDNFGGQIIEDLVKLIDPSVAYLAVRASRGKIVRAEPIAALYEQGSVHHVGMFKELEDELCSYAPLVSTESPGRLDAMVWALTELMLSGSTGTRGIVTEGAPNWTRQRGFMT